ncbi:MAG: phage baseplate assembly protein V [Myxococcota bacterium]
MVETALAEVVAVGTGTHKGQVRIRLYAYDGATEQDAELWARVAVPVAGGDRGTFLVPSKGDEVLVTFVGGDSRLPVVLGSLWNGRDAAPEEPGNAEPVETWSFTSPRGTTVTVHETSAADSTVTIDIPNKATATFSAEGSGKIELRAGGSTMVMDAQGIRFDTSGEFCATSATACHSASMVEFDAAVVVLEHPSAPPARPTRSWARSTRRARGHLVIAPRLDTHPVTLRAPAFLGGGDAPVVPRLNDQRFLPTLFADLRDPRGAQPRGPADPGRRPTLYLPVHRTFNIVLAEAVCDVPGQPPRPREHRQRRRRHPAPHPAPAGRPHRAAALGAPRRGRDGLAVGRRPARRRRPRRGPAPAGRCGPRRHRGRARAPAPGRGAGLRDRHPPVRRPARRVRGGRRHPAVRRRRGGEPPARRASAPHPHPRRDGRRSRGRRPAELHRHRDPLDGAGLAARPQHPGTRPAGGSPAAPSASTTPAAPTCCSSRSSTTTTAPGAPSTCRARGPRWARACRAAPSPTCATSCACCRSCSSSGTSGEPAAARSGATLRGTVATLPDGGTSPLDELLQRAAAVFVLQEEGATVTFPEAWPLVGAEAATAVQAGIQSALEARLEQFVRHEGRFDRPEARYHLRAFARVRRDDGCPPALVWSANTPEYRVARWFEGAPEGAVIPTIELPTIDRGFLKNLRPNVTLKVPRSLFNFLQNNAPDEFLGGEARNDTSGPAFQWICGFNISIIFMIAFMLLITFVFLLNIVFWWVAFFRICIPLPGGLFDDGEG